ncbi:MAG: hypothetical protein WD294_12195 [Phycisphaeraceae bacterium]
MQQIIECEAGRKVAGECPLQDLRPEECQRQQLADPAFGDLELFGELRK